MRGLRLLTKTDGIAAAFALLLSGPIVAHAGTQADSALHILQAKDARLNDVAWKLVRGNAQSCERTRLASGLLLQDMAGYGDADAARAALGVTGDFAVQAAAKDSPAARAGLRANQTVLSIDGTGLADLVAGRTQAWERLRTAKAALDSALADDGVALLATSADGPVLALLGEEACTVDFEIRTGHSSAVADWAVVYIGDDFPGLSYVEDEFAAAVAHEMAHVILRHPAWLTERGRKRKDVRMTEREADRLMPWLLANAGYDPEAALRFMRRWGPAHGGGLFRKRTHDGWDERVEFIEAELPLVRAALARDGHADWRARFPAKDVD